jgi:BolA protein
MPVVQDQVEQRLTEHFSPLFAEIVNESHMHSVPPGSESHFKVTLVSHAFEGLGLVKRHQEVYRILQPLMGAPIHALALHTYTENEWSERSGSPDSPNCMGGSKG